MHTGEVEVPASLLHRLLADQFPEWADLPLASVPSFGTDHALFRLGDDMLVRLPRIDWAVGGVDKDLLWLPRLAPHLPVEIPVPLAAGVPGAGYPWPWGVYPWLQGDHPPVRACDESLTRDLATFVQALHAVDLPEGPPARRGQPLIVQDEEARLALVQLEGTIDVAAATAAWEEALAAPPWTGPGIWIHGDLLGGNLLLRDRRLSAVIDWGGLGVGDPACDLLVAWAVLAPAARHAFRDLLGVDDATWVRGRGWALSVGLILLPYYKETNPELAAVGRHLVDEVFAERAARA